MKNYGNTFDGGREAIDAGRVPIWNSVDEIYPSGCTFKTQTPFTTIPAGTAVYVPKIGGEAVVHTAETAASEDLKVTGLLLEDVYVGANGATGTVVTKGSILAARSATLSAAVRAIVEGRITFIEE